MVNNTAILNELKRRKKQREIEKQGIIEERILPELEMKHPKGFVFKPKGGGIEEYLYGGGGKRTSKFRQIPFSRKI